MARITGTIPVEASDLPILYSFRRCPYAMRARLALLISQTDCELREVKLAAKPLAMLAASPKGTVPVLVLPDGRVIDESLEIMRWCLSRHDPEGWLERDDPAMIASNDGVICPLLSGPASVLDLTMKEECHVEEAQA